MCFSIEGGFGFNPQNSFTTYYEELLQSSQTINLFFLKSVHLLRGWTKCVIFDNHSFWDQLLLYSLFLGAREEKELRGHSYVLNTFWYFHVSWDCPPGLHYSFGFVRMQLIKTSSWECTWGPEGDLGRKCTFSRTGIQVGQAWPSVPEKGQTTTGKDRKGIIGSVP